MHVRLLNGQRSCYVNIIMPFSALGQDVILDLALYKFGIFIYLFIYYLQLETWTHFYSIMSLWDYSMDRQILRSIHG